MDRLSRPVAVLAVLTLIAACSPAVTPAPSTAPPASPGSSGAASAQPSGGAAATPCEIVAEEGPLRSSKLVGVAVVTGDTGDSVVFRFGLDAPTGTNQPIGRLEAATPPFTADPSGLPLDVPGTRFARVRLSGLVLYDDAGTPTFTGSDRIEPVDAAAVRAVVREGDFEGVSSWLIGFDGPGCVTVGIGDATTTVIRVEGGP
jgi:hypothetical protein